MKNIRLSPRVLKKITDPNQERNIYIHPNPIARDIFWQRLEMLYKLILKYCHKDMQVLDFGGGSGIFAKILCKYFTALTIIDLDNNDARNIIQHYHLKNINLIDKDVNLFSSKRKFDVIVAADVLEHFANLKKPLIFFKKFLKNNGYLFLSSPTENWIYDLGRIIIKKDKPITHYHRSSVIIDYLAKNGFALIKRQYCPKYVLPIPLFDIAVLQYRK